MRYCVRTLAVTMIGLTAGLSPPGPATAVAQTATTAADLSGAWTIGDDFSDIHCDVHLTEKHVGTGFAIEFAATCGSDFPVLAGVVAWRPDGQGGIVLLDASGAAVIDYAVSETESLLSVAPHALMLHMTPERADPTMVGSIADRADHAVDLRTGIF